jgi:pilus assembly protein CpaB
MNRRLLSVLIFALVVASATSYLAYRLILVRILSQGQPVATNLLVVASHDLQVGVLIHDSDLEAVPWSGPIPEQAIKTLPDAAGRGVIANIYRGEPILSGRLASRGAGAGLASTIPIGMRAVAIRVNEVVGLAGFVMPGMRVDVLMAGNLPTGESRAGTLCRTILQNIEVLSAGQTMEKKADSKPESAQVVNLLVTPDQAETLNLASSETKVQLVLRNPLDTKTELTQGTSIARLFGVSETAPAVERTASRSTQVKPLAPLVHSEPPTQRVEVFRGGTRTEEVFAVPQGKNE